MLIKNKLTLLKDIYPNRVWLIKHANILLESNEIMPNNEWNKTPPRISVGEVT